MSVVGTMVVADAKFELLVDRVVDLEQKYAVREETLKAIEIRLSRIETVLSRLTWLMVTGIGGAFVAFVIGGGLANVTAG